VQPSLLTRIRWRLEELRHVDDAKIIGGLLLVGALTLGGFLAARTVAGASAGPRSATRVVTVREKVRVRKDGHLVTRWRVRRLSAAPQTVMRTEKINTPSGTRLVTHPVTSYRVVYRNHGVNVPAKTVTAIRQVTESRVETITRRVTVVETTTAVSTKTITLPITVTVTVP
jgi:hypothetical protein